MEKLEWTFWPTQYIWLIYLVRIYIEMYVFVYILISQRKTSLYFFFFFFPLSMSCVIHYRVEIMINAICWGPCLQGPYHHFVFIWKHLRICCWMSSVSHKDAFRWETCCSRGSFCAEWQESPSSSGEWIAGRDFLCMSSVSSWQLYDLRYLECSLQP